MSEDADGDLDVDAIREVLAASPATVGVLYGSHARGDAGPSSDVDVAVAFPESLSARTRTRARLRLIDRLTVTLGTDDVDVVPLSGAPESLRRTIDREGVVVYGSLDDALSTDSSAETTRDERLAAFDDLLADIDRVV